MLTPWYIFLQLSFLSPTCFVENIRKTVPKTLSTISKDKPSRLLCHAAMLGPPSCLPKQRQVGLGVLWVLWKSQTATAARALDLSGKDSQGRGDLPVHFLCPQQLGCLGNQKSMLSSYPSGEVGAKANFQGGHPEPPAPFRGPAWLLPLLSPQYLPNCVCT